MYSYIQFGDVAILSYFVDQLIYLKFEGIMVPSN